MRHRSHRLHRTIAGAVALSFALFSMPGTTVHASPSDELTERTDTVYRLRPDEGRVHVESVVTLTNRSKPTTRRGPCRNGKGSCKITTRYYFTGWGRFWTPHEAENVKVGGPGVKAKPAEAVGGGLAYGVTYPKLWNKKGAKQKVTLSFDIPAGTVETTDEPTRVEDAYAFFCWWGMAGDRGTTKAIMPAGWEVIAGADVVIERRPDATIVTASSTKNPADFIECTEAYRPDALERTYVTGEGGKSLVVIEAWPGHGSWAADAAAVAAEALTTLESMLGSAMPYGELRIREAANQSRRYDWADVRPVDGVIRMSEDVRAADYLPSRLARAWVDPTRFSDVWLAEGIADWLGTQAMGEQCRSAGAHPGPEPPDIDAWRAAEADVAIRDWQRSTACHLIETGASAIGDDAMLELVRQLTEAPVPVGASHWLAGVSRDLPDGLDMVLSALDEAGADH